MRRSKLNYRRTLRYYYYRMVRLNGTPSYLARGMAVGLFVAFLMPVGLQTIVALPLAFVFRASKVLAFVGTMATNYATMLVLYPLQCWLGSYLLFRPLSYALFKQHITAFLATPTLENFWQLGLEILLPFFAGGLFLAVIFAVAGYYATYHLVAGYRQLRRRRKNRRQPRT